MGVPLQVINTSFLSNGTFFNVPPSAQFLHFQAAGNGQYLSE